MEQVQIYTPQDLAEIRSKNMPSFYGKKPDKWSLHNIKEYFRKSLKTSDSELGMNGIYVKGIVTSRIGIGEDIDDLILSYFFGTGNIRFRLDNSLLCCLKTNDKSKFNQTQQMLTQKIGQETYLKGDYFFIKDMFSRNGVFNVESFYSDPQFTKEIVSSKGEKIKPGRIFHYPGK